MTSMTAARPTQGATDQIRLTDDVARELASSYPVAELAGAGYLAGPDGHAVAGQMREPQLNDAVRQFGRCSDTNDVNAFYQREEEQDEEWRERRERTIAQYCAPCPIAAACLELALRYPEEPRDLAVRGGTTEESQLARVAAETMRLSAARGRDRAPGEQRAERLTAAREVQTLARTHIGLSVEPKYRNKNHADTRAAVSRLKELQGQHRRATGWAA
ncbi:WhiB family transcriptional regulator [Streptomyces sp. NBC_01433]|uniref:WhiB family transcriptional regulator n=1 Tax=Streptomyces sp. NBC_01433 TaxID=2903864 RepID=UPI00224FB96F|nr:WhiB family transcriptional regulator [Streptomyces sp. NBC_01433]MCX4682321.1 WhiB family transcriptional regulator [Streptomyces sp. NBC_01433]